MSRTSFLFSLFLCASVLGVSRASAREIIPAGTILQCTVSETNFSAKTAQVGDPVLCHLGPFGAFGHSVFPRGAELGGHLEDAKNPGHFVGKGWLEVNFDRMILPGAQILPLAAKVVSSPHMKVDSEGKIHGKGHPVRDSVEWAIPILWPIKVITLPARGPFPALKGETRLSLRLMEDVEVPFQSARNVPAPPWASPSSYQPASYRVARPPVARLEEAALRADDNHYRQPAYQPMQPVASQTSAVAAPPATEAQLTVLALQSGEAYLAREYWVQAGEVHCLSAAGEEKIIPLDQMDLFQTASLNRQRNIKFVLQSRDVVQQ
jgi:hypothetical protein